MLLTPNIHGEPCRMIPHACPVICSTCVGIAMHTAVNIGDRQFVTSLSLFGTVLPPLVVVAGLGISVGDVTTKGVALAFDGVSLRDAYHVS